MNKEKCLKGLFSLNKKQDNDNFKDYAEMKKLIENLEKEN